MTNSRATISRRDLFFRYGPAAALALPILRARPARAQARVPRFVTFFSSSGVRPDLFWPQGTPGRASSGSYSVAGTSLAALQPYLEDVIIPKGISIDRGIGDSHNAGSASILTGRHLRSTEFNRTPFGGGESLDHFLGRRFAGVTPEPYLLLGVRLQFSRISKYISYDENGQHQEYVQDPRTAYDRVLAPVVDVRCGSDDAAAVGAREAAARIRFRRRSVLDAVRGQLRGLESAYGMDAEERRRLDRIGESIRSIERRLEDPTVTGPSELSPHCAELRDRIATGPRVANEDTNFPALLRLHSDIVALALELDVTRVATLALSLGGSGGAPMRWLQWRDARGRMAPIEASHHNVSHGTQRGVENYLEKLEVIDRWNFEQFAYLVGRLKEVREGDYSLLDNSILWYATDVGYGKTHNSVDMPFIVAGRGAGAIDSGRYVQLTGEPPHQRLLTTFLHAMGVTDRGWGREESQGDPLI